MQIGAALAATTTAAVIVAGLSAAPATETLTGRQAEVRQLEAQLIALDGEATAAADAHSSAAGELQQARADVAQNTRDLKLARKNRERALANLERRLVAIYRTKQPTVAEIVLSSGDINSAMDQLDLLNRAGAQDSEVLRSVRETRERLAASRGELISRRKEALEYEAETRTRREAMERLLTERRGVLARARTALADAQASQAAGLAAAQAEAERRIRERAEPGAPEPEQTSQEPSPVGGDVAAHLQRIAQCESGGNPRAISPGGLYRGKYQFHPDTWRSVGGSGDPAAASEAEQDKRAAILYAREGPGPWPVCGS